MARANPRLPRSIRTRVEKIPDYKVEQYVKSTPRFKLGERREALQGAMNTKYMRSDVKEAIRKARESGAAATHEDPKVRYFLSKYGSEAELTSEGLKNFFEGAERFLAGHRAFRFKYATRPGHVEEDARVKSKLLARETTEAKKQEMLDETREVLARKQRRADLRDPEKRQEIFRPGMAKAMGSSVVQKETTPASIFDYKPGSAPGETPNPANAGTPNPTGPSNPANATPQNPTGSSPAGPLPLAGFRGLSHTPGHTLPGEVAGPSHAPAAPLGGGPRASDGPSGSVASASPIGPSEPPSESPSEAPPDMEIG